MTSRSRPMLPAFCALLTTLSTLLTRWEEIPAGVDPRLRAILTSHFKDCCRCRAVLDGTRNIVTLIGDSQAFGISETSRERLYKKLNDHLAARGPRGVVTV